jgi:type II secretory pathway component GspD/PulD (secretin)
MDSLITLIQDTVAPQSWYDAGGEATITAYESKKLVVLQTPENHREIVKLLQEMRKALGHQISIEARFLVVGENFLEEIGLDAWGSLYIGQGLGTANWRSDSFGMAAPEATGISGSFDISKSTVQFPPPTPPESPRFISQGALMANFGGRFGGILDGLEANFLIRATQAHRDSESLVAPKVTVLSGESATLQVRRTIRFALPPVVSVSTVGTGGGVGSSIGSGSQLTPQYGEIPTGPTLNITPTITPDRKHVLLNIVAELMDFLGYEDSVVDALVLGNGTTQQTMVVPYKFRLPQTERSRVKTRVSVPDGGTLLLGGLKRSAAAEKEVGVPVLSKIPIIGRAFTNRSKIADQKVLLILVKPTIILQEEADAEAIAAMEGQ